MLLPRKLLIAIPASLMSPCCRMIIAVSILVLTLAHPRIYLCLQLRRAIVNPHRRCGYRNLQLTKIHTLVYCRLQECTPVSEGLDAGRDLEAVIRSAARAAALDLQGSVPPPAIHMLSCSPGTTMQSLSLRQGCSIATELITPPKSEQANPSGHHSLGFIVFI